MLTKLYMAITGHIYLGSSEPFQSQLPLRSWISLWKEIHSAQALSNVELHMWRILISKEAIFWSIKAQFIPGYVNI